MNIIDKLGQIIKIQDEHSDEKIGDFNRPVTQKAISQIETLIKEPLLENWKELYQFANGQTKNGKGLLFGHRFMNSDEIIRQLEFSLTLAKPENKIIENIEKSNELLNKIVNFYVQKAPKHKMFGLKKSWFKIEFKCGIGSYGGPYLYQSENTTSKDREVFKIDFEDYKNLVETIKELHELEKETYNWDELEFIVFADGKFDCERTFYDFDNQITFTSSPENTIKKKYFHFKWIPIFSDFGGNYIGIDLDPDTKGKKGQIIIFGRDEENMVVLADNLELFFDFLLTEMTKPENKLLHSDNHIHDTLREQKK